MKGSRVRSKFEEGTGHCPVYVLGPDLKARGFGDDRVIEGINVVDYGGFVDLAAEHDKVQAWL